MTSLKKLPWIIALGLLSAVLVAQEPQTPDDAGATEDGAPVAVQEDPAAPEAEPEADAAEPDAEALAEAAAAAGGEIGEVEEDFTPEDEISEDYPVPLPADI